MIWVFCISFRFNLIKLVEMLSDHLRVRRLLRGQQEEPSPAELLCLSPPACPFVFDGSVMFVLSGGRTQAELCYLPSARAQSIHGWTTRATMKGPDYRKASYLANRCRG